MEPAKEQKTVTVNRRLRPIRLAFLVSPEDKKNLRRAIQINTCLWGGIFNPIIPFFKRTPPQFIEGRYKPTARSIIDGYIGGFSPDYLVVQNKAAVRALGFPEKRVVEFSEVIMRKDKQPLGFGLDVSWVYKDLYKREFKFQRRHPLRVILPRPAVNSPDLFYAAHFGEFPSETELAYIARNFKELGAEESEIEPSQFFDTLFQYPLYPLKAGKSHLEVRGGDRDPQVFFMDAGSPLDLMDYWNLRAAGRYVIPFPAQLADYGIEKLSAFISENHVPHRHNKKIMLSSGMICSGSQKMDAMEAFVEKLKIPNGSLCIQHYPRLWNQWAREEAFEEIGVLTAKEDSITVTSSYGRVQFSTLKPEFVKRLSSANTPHWVNAIKLSQEGFDSPSVIPPGMPDIERILCYGSPYPLWVTGEGIVVSCAAWSDSQFWKLPTSIEIFKKYFGSHGYQAEISGAGKIALQVLRALKGIWGILSLSNEEILRKLEAMARGIGESDADTDTPNNAVKQKTRANTVSFQAWWGLLQRANDGSPEIAQNCLRNLLSSDVFRLGLRLQCPHCSQHTWFDLKQLDRELICERCLQVFPFPAKPPANDAWHYRTIGPFSIEGYAHGSYCALLASNFLFEHRLGNSEKSWVPGLILKDLKNPEINLEVDFSAFWGPDIFGQRTSPLLVLGECKTFDEFKAKDVQRMTILADAFPGALIVFCTLRKQLSKREKRLITPLATRGRRYFRDDRWRNPVMVLTGIELLHRMGPPSCWEEAGSPYKEFVENYWQHRKPQELCDMLQQMHLGMEPHYAWYDRQRRKKLAQRDRRKSGKISLATPPSKVEGEVGGAADSQRGV